MESAYGPAPFIVGTGSVIPGLAFAVLMFVVVMVGLLLMAQILSFEEIGAALWRGFVILALGGIAVWLLKGILLPIFICGLVLLKSLVLWILVMTLLIVAVLVSLRLVIAKYGKSGFAKVKHKENRL